MNKDLTRQLLVVVAVVATIAINGLANALPINGLTTGEISDSFPVYFTPDGYVFGIWGLIYAGLIAYAIYQALPAQRLSPRLRSIRIPFLVGSLANIAWIIFWHYQVFLLTLVAMLALLGSLIAIYGRLRIGRSSPPAIERWVVDLPFSIYLGWITVATVANATVLLSYLNWNGFGVSEEVWLALVLAVALVIATVMALTRRDVAYLLVLAWAFAGIGVKHLGVDVVSTAAWAATGYVLALVVVSVLRGGHKQPAPALAA